ncbi:MAG TPA: hypothetical protein VNM14_20975 [Planctomycetota bacterium]|jgi:hypothetical protein|nr:hypothetical protein [Planctomycetota bacterium]
MMCPGPEQAAAYADGRLDAADSARYLEHCSECEECRRTLAFLSLPFESAPVPADREARAVSALRRSLDRDRTPRGLRRPALPAKPPTSRIGFAIAAALLVGFVVLLAIAKERPARVSEPRDVVVYVDTQVPPAPPRNPQPQVLPPPVPEVPVAEAPPKPFVIDTPRAPAPPRLQEEPKFALQVEQPLRVLPKPEEIRPEEPPARPAAHTVVARSLTELQVTDISGTLMVHRKGAKAKEKLSGVAHLGEGDVLSAEKSASFRVEGRHPVVLGENSSVSMAYVAQEQAPWLRLHSGEAMVDSTGSARWVVTDGVVAVAVKPARARFTAARGDARLSLASLSEPLYVQPDGGAVHAIHVGEELQIGKASAEVKPVDAALVAKKLAAFDAARPKFRTLFYTSCDPADAKREHFFVQEGAWWKNEGLYSRERADRTAVASLGPNPRFSWGEKLTIRVRYSTNCKSIEIQQRVDERKYTLFKTLPVDKKSAGLWQTVEIPFTPAAWQFRRDDGVNQLIVTTEDKVDAIRFVAKPNDVFGDAKPYVLIDDIQVTERE